MKTWARRSVWFPGLVSKLQHPKYLQMKLYYFASSFKYRNKTQDVIDSKYFLRKWMCLTSRMKINDMTTVEYTFLILLSLESLTGEDNETSNSDSCCVIIAPQLQCWFTKLDPVELSGLRLDSAWTERVLTSALLWESEPFLWPCSLSAGVTMVTLLAKWN